MRHQEEQNQPIPTLGIQALHERAKHDRLNSLLQKPITDIINDYEYEMGLKNQAYYFILESGNLQNFSNFCNQNPKL